MKGSLAIALALAFAGVMASRAALAQAPAWPSPSAGPMVGGAPSAGPGPGAGPGTLTAAPPSGARPAGPPQCMEFVKFRDEAQHRANAVTVGNQKHVERKEMCGLVTKFTAAEGAVVKFLIDNKTTCGIPDEVIKQVKTNHEKTMKFRTVVCTEAPGPKPPTLSEAIGGPTVDSANNTKLGRGTLDTLTGNPLAK